MGVIELFVLPQGGEGGTVVGKEHFRQGGHAVDVEQRAVGVGNGFDREADMVFPAGR